MQPKTHTEELLERLSTRALPTEDVAHAVARRDRVVAHLQEIIPTLPGRRRRRWMGTASVSAAAIVALGAGLSALLLRSSTKEVRPVAVPTALLALQGSVQVIHRSAEVVAPPLAPMPIDGADEIVTGEEGRARVSLASGAEVDIGPESKVRLRGANDASDDRGAASSAPQAREGVVLGAGRVAVRVPKLGPTRSFTVETPEATIAVHGTAFSVERFGGGGAPPRTDVHVVEGRVAVLHRGAEVLLRAGDAWSSAARRVDSEAGSVTDFGAPSGTSASKMRPSAAVHSPGGSARGSVENNSAEKGSSLAAENRLLQAAMAARQKGDARRAAELTTELVNRYPASPLVEEARVERMRALFDTGGPSAAEAEARAYLAAYPRGFARPEASRILAGVPR